MPGPLCEVMLTMRVIGGVQASANDGPMNTQECMLVTMQVIACL